MKLSMDSMMMRACQAGNYQDIVHTGGCLCMKQALVVVHVLCDTVNPYLWNNCDSFKVFEK